MEVMKLENITEYFFSFKITWNPRGSWVCDSLANDCTFWGKDIDLIGVGRTK